MTAYLHVEIELTDPAGFEAYARDVPAMVAAFGGRYLVRGGAAEVVEGDEPLTRIVALLEFPSMERLKAFLAAPEYQPLKAVRQASSRCRLVALPGVDEA